jgi:hypothetical protein
MFSPLTSMAVYSASTLTVIVISEPSMVIGLCSRTTTEVSTPCQDENIMTDSNRVPPGSITTNPEIPSENLQAILNPNNQSPITIEGSEITITVNVEAEYTAIEVNGENIKITTAEYIPVGSNVRQPLVSIQFDFIVD